MQFCFRRDLAQINRMGLLCSCSALATMPNSAIPALSPSRHNPSPPSPHLPCTQQPSSSNFPSSFLLPGAIICGTFPPSIVSRSACMPALELEQKTRKAKGHRRSCTCHGCRAHKVFYPNPWTLKWHNVLLRPSFTTHHTPFNVGGGRAPSLKAWGPQRPSWTPPLSETMGGNGAQFLVQYKHGEHSRKKAWWWNERPLSASVGDGGYVRVCGGVLGTRETLLVKTKTKSKRNRDGVRRGPWVTWLGATANLSRREREGDKERKRESEETERFWESMHHPSGPSRVGKKRKETEMRKR